jgi:hypothetical protein
MTRTFTRIFYNLFLLLGLFAIHFSATAQRFDFQASTGTFTPLAGASAIDDIEDDEEISSAINIGFSFNYYGSAYTQFKASSNGFITLDLSTSSATFTNDLTTNGKLFIAPLWDDMSGSSGQASYQLTGISPNQVLTIEWLNWKWTYTAASPGISFQVKLYETSNKIEYVYRQESGALTSAASASIGLSGNAAGKFYSLPNSSSSVVLIPAGSNSISAKPATGQIFSFTPNAVAIVAPTSQATAITTPAIGAKTFTFGWSIGNGAYRAVFMKQTASTSESPTVTDGIYYSASTTFGSGSTAGSGWYCIYNGLSNSVNVTGLQSDMPYRIQVVEYNGLGSAQKYNTTTETGNPLNVTTLLEAPTTPVSTISVLRASGTEVAFTVVNGDGAKRAVFMKAATTDTAPVVNNTTYTANATFGLGTQIGVTGWFCVFNGTNAFNHIVTGLVGGASYQIFVADYNGSPGAEKYNTTSVTNNPVQVTTLVNIPAMTYTFAASSGTFTPITGGTAVDDIETDDNLSAQLPIGFTFRLSGVPYTQLYASSNGFLSFNPYILNVGSSGASNDLSSSLHRSLVAPLWDDLDGAGGVASYVTTGSAPNRVFTFEWLNWEWDYSATDGISFQVKLYEADGKIEYIYRQEAGALVSPDASIGMAFSNVGSGNFISLNNSSATPTASTTAEVTTIATKPATGQVYSFTPQKLNQTITFSSITDKFFGNGTFTLSAISTSGLAITFTSSNTAVATVSGNVVTMTGVGSATITASQAGDVNFNAATSVDRAFVVNKGNQTISFSNPGTYSFGSQPGTLVATASSGLAVTFVSSNTAVATVSGNTVTIVAPGTADITASQAGNSNYNAAPDVVRTLTVVKANQTISFDFLPTDKKVGDAAFTITSTSSSGLPVTFTSSNTAVATVSGNTVTIVNGGTTNIIASQAGNTNYNAAVDVSRSLVIKLTQTITLPEITDKTQLDNLTVTATASSSLPVSLYITLGSSGSSMTNGVAEQLLGYGKATVTASQSGNAEYAPAPSVSRTFCVNPTTPVTMLQENGDQLQVLVNTNVTNVPVGSSQQWYRGGVAISGATTTSYTVDAAGVYTFVTTTSDGCASAPSIGIATIVTGVEVLEAGVKIYPNPVENELVVDVTSLHSKEPVSLTIYDVSGRTMQSTAGNGKVHIKMNNYNAGQYLLKIQDNKRVITKHITKK